MVDQAEDGATAPQNPRAGSRRVRITDRRRVCWSEAMKETFLDHLASTCNVKDAAAAIGVAQCSVYFLRRRDSDFAAAWSKALALGYEMLETRLVGHALAGGAGAVGDRGGDANAGGNEDGERDGIDVSLALRLLNRHGRALSGRAGGGGPRPQTATRQETNAAILKRLRVMEAQQRAEDALSRPPAALAIVDGRTGLVDTPRADSGA
jgi:hypothetical protein